MRIFKTESRESRKRKVTGDAEERARNIKGDIPGTPGLIFTPREK